MAAKKITVALLAGGKSGEREVSLKGADGVAKALDFTRYEVRRYDPATDMAKIAADADAIDMAFILMHGPFGEDGTVQGFLDLLGIPYQGSGVLGSAMAMHKHIAKLQYQKAGLTVPPWRLLRRGEVVDCEEIIAELGLPLVIKPASQGSSLGMSIARSGDALVTGLEKAFACDAEVMVEAFIKGREITGGVLGNEDLAALPLVEIIPGEKYDFFDYEAKYQPGASREVCPAELDAGITVRAQKIAVTAHRALCLRGYSRTDMIVRDNDIFVLETNTIPGMTPTSLFPQAAKAHGLDFPALLDRLIELALEKK